MLDGESLASLAADVSGFVPGGEQHAGMRRRNESAVLRAVLAYGPITRAQISPLTQLSAPSVTKVTGWLIKSGFLQQESTARRHENGRPATPLTIRPDVHLSVGVHIGLEFTTVGVVALDGTVVEQFRLPHTSRRADAILDELQEALAQLWSRIDPHALIAGIGISTGGLVDAAKGVVLEQEALGWRNVAVVDELAPRLPYPVRLDANYRALAEAELWFGVGREVADFFLLFAGNVIGGTLVSGRRLHDGGGRAGAIAHVPIAGYEHVTCTCGRTACLHAVASDRAVIKEAERVGIDCHGSLLRLAAIARDGNRDAARILEERARLVGRWLGSLVDTLDPERIVLAGGLVEAPEYLPALKDEVIARAYHAGIGREGIAVTSFGAGSLVVSAAAPVLRAIFDDPSEFSAIGRAS